MSKSVAILYICTGKYEVFWRDFYQSYEKFFLPNCLKEYYVFTDADKIYDEENQRVHKIYQKSLGWPNNTLRRFHIFSPYFEKFKEYDYLFFMNANCQCISEVTEEEFLPLEKELLVVKHPGFYDKQNCDFTYERNPKSSAYIPEGMGKYYICGGVNGGESVAFVTLMQSLMQAIDADKANGIVALWHDESHINRYILEHDNYRILSPAYCYPEGEKLPFPEKIRIRNKSNWIDVDKIKNAGLRKKIQKKFRIIKQRILKY